jgi:large subunit ribosomal protein L9
MEVILLHDVQGLGSRGDRKSVASGYARNFLLPRKLALPATSAGAHMFEEGERIRQVRHQKERRQAEALAHRLEKLSVTVHAQVGEDDKLFGSVTAQDIAEAAQAAGFEIDRRQIQLEEPLRALGVYRVDVKLHPEVMVPIKLWVAKVPGKTPGEAE